MKNLILESIEIADILGYKRNYISELVNKHGMPKKGFNKFDLREVIPWHIQHMNKIHVEEIEKIRSDKPQDELARKQAKLKQMDIEERQEKLIDADLVRMAWLNEIKVFDLNIDSIEATLIIGLKSLLTNVEKGNEIIRNTVKKTKEKIANTEIDI